MYVVLSYYGWDLRAVLTTSAIVYRGDRFRDAADARQRNFGHLNDMDHRLRVGDGIIRGGEAIEIESLGWRNVVGRKGNGQLVVFLDARLADAEVELRYRPGRLVRGETSMKILTAHAPDQIGAMVDMLLGDLLVDPKPRAERHAKRVPTRAPPRRSTVYFRPPGSATIAASRSIEAKY